MNFINGMSAGYAAGRAAMNARTAASAASTSRLYNLGFKIGNFTGGAVRIANNAITFIGTGIKQFAIKFAFTARWLAQKSASALKFVWRGIKFVASKVYKAGRLVAIKMKALGREVANIVRDQVEYVRRVKDNTKDLYKLKNFRYSARHGHAASKGTKARFAYDSFVQGRVDAKKELKDTPAKSRVVQFKRDFVKGAGNVMANIGQRLSDATLVAAGIGGIYHGIKALATSKADKEEEAVA